MVVSSHLRVQCRREGADELRRGRVAARAVTRERRGREVAWLVVRDTVRDKVRVRVRVRVELRVRVRVRARASEAER